MFGSLPASTLKSHEVEHTCPLSSALELIYQLRSYSLLLKYLNSGLKFSDIQKTWTQVDVCLSTCRTSKVQRGDRMSSVLCSWEYISAPGHLLSVQNLDPASSFPDIRNTLAGLYVCLASYIHQLQATSFLLKISAQVWAFQIFHMEIAAFYFCLASGCSKVDHTRHMFFFFLAYIYISAPSRLLSAQISQILAKVFWISKKVCRIIWCLSLCLCVLKVWREWQMSSVFGFWAYISAPGRLLSALV